MKKEKEFYPEENHEAFYYEYLDVACMWNGYHSGAIGGYFGKGILPAIKYDTRKIFDYVDVKDDLTVVYNAKNIVNRNFKTDKPNKLWLTDITEFKIGNNTKKIYLSPILDTFNGEIISYSIGFNPTVTLTNKSLEKALKRIKNKEDLTIHTDQGFHYQHSSFVRTLENNNIRQSMSRKGNCLDNAPMENFFGILKQEMFYGENYSSYEKLIEDIKEYIKWYHH